MKKKLTALLMTLVFAISMPLSAFANSGYIPGRNVGVPDPNYVYQTYSYPSSADLSKYIPRILDQEDRPWCVAYSICIAVEAQMRMNNLKVPEEGFSPAYLYARCKAKDGIPNQQGTYIDTALEIAKTEGLCPEVLCPTDGLSGSSPLPIITQAMKDAAANYKIQSYTLLNDSGGYVNIDKVRNAIATGHFVVYGTFVDQSWNTENKGYLLDPYGYIRGSHAVIFDQYDMKQTYGGYASYINGTNSWGSWWGQNGRFLMTENYATWKDTIGMPMLLEAYSMEVQGEPIDIRFMDMPIPLQIINPGYTVLPFRVIFEALGGTVDWGRNEAGKIWVKGTVELKSGTVTLEMTQDNPVLKVVRE